VENHTDEKIMQSIRDGNIAGMSVLFERYHKRIYNYFLKMGLGRDASQDLTQNLFYRIIKYRSSYKDGSQMKSWIYQIARNLHKDYCNLQKKADDVFVRIGTTTQGVPEDGPEFMEEDYERLDRSLLSLDDGVRELIVLSRFQGLKYEEISLIVNQSVPAIKVTIHRAIKQLRSIYFKQV
jgi:RNA polymerase sigma factor (sigma-70 family)